MICLANTCEPRVYFWLGVYPWCREHLQTDSDTVLSVLLPSWYMNILSVPRWEAAAGKAAWEWQLWEWGFCSSSHCEGLVPWWGQLSYPLPCTAEKGTPSACGSPLAPSPPSLSSRKSLWLVLGWSLSAAQLPKPLTDRCSYKKSKDKPNFLWQSNRLTGTGISCGFESLLQNIAAKLSSLCPFSSTYG